MYQTYTNLYQHKLTNIVNNRHLGVLNMLNTSARELEKSFSIENVLDAIYTSASACGKDSTDED